VTLTSKSAPAHIAKKECWTIEEKSSFFVLDHPFRVSAGETIMRQLLLYGAAGALALTLFACGGKPSAVQSASPQVSADAPQASAPTTFGDQHDANVPKVDGKPMWASNRTHTAEENAQYQFTKNGRDFAASSESDYVAKVHAFVEHPPSDVQTLDRRNGDRLMYAASENIFVVVTRDGAPRTMFKPRGGVSYWSQQKDRESQSSNSGNSGGGDQNQG
jgi:hypothetical protein